MKELSGVADFVAHDGDAVVHLVSGDAREMTLLVVLLRIDGEARCADLAVLGAVFLQRGDHRGDSAVILAQRVVDRCRNRLHADRECVTIGSDGDAPIAADGHRLDRRRHVLGDCRGCKNERDER